MKQLKSLEEHHLVLLLDSWIVLLRFELTPEWGSLTVLISSGPNCFWSLGGHTECPAFATREFARTGPRFRPVWPIRCLGP